MRLCLVPRWGATSDMEWYPWLCDQPVVRDRFARVVKPSIDRPGTPTIAAWVDSLVGTLGRDAAALADTWLLGHSVGCQAILRYLATLSGQVAGCLLVAGWWTVDKPWDSIRPWLYPPGDGHTDVLDVARVRAACARLFVLISDNDPFTADWQTTRRHWEERVGATVRVISGAKHFNSAEAPAVVTALEELVR